MSTEVNSNHSVFIKGRGPYQLARAVKMYAEEYMGDKVWAGSVARGCDDVLGGDFLTRWGGGEVGRIISLPFEGQKYTLKYYIYKDKGMIATHPGETPTVDPIRITAQLIDSLASSQSNKRGLDW